MENISKIYINMIRLLEEKTEITLGEINHILRAIRFIIKSHESEEKPSQFLRDSYMIEASLSLLRDEKLYQYRKDLETIKKKINNMGRKLPADNEHLQYLLQLDCMQQRSFSFSEKLEYLCRAYENLIAHYQTTYIPVPSITRRIKTSNLLLLFNKEINISFKLLKISFFGIKENSDFSKENPEGVFSTWSFSSYEHVKYIDDSKREFISFSFWFYENQIFYPIAFHEMSHVIYMQKENTIKLGDNEKKEMASMLLQSDENSFTKSFLYTIHQDIIADFSAYSLSGPSYIFALFYTGLMQELHKNFYKDIDIENEINQKNMDNDDRRCEKRHNHMTLLDWAHNMNRESNFISFYVRIKLLIKLYENTTELHDKIFINEIKGIQSTLNLVYPDEYFDEKYNTFEQILNSFEAQGSNYHYAKNFTFLLLNLMKEEVFSKKKLDKKIKNILNKNKQIFQDNRLFREIVQEYLNNSDFEESYKSFFSIYDLFWKYRFDYKNDISSGGRILRLYNLINLEIISDTEDIDLKDIIFELIFFKFYNNDESSYIKFQEDTNFFSDNFDGRITHAFGPYDIVSLSQKTTSNVDKWLKELNEKNKNIFFTERHALFLVKEIFGKDGAKNNRYFDLSISIDSVNEFQKDKFKLLFKEIKNGLNELKTIFNNAKIFASLGNENFIVYVEGIRLCDIEGLTKKYYESNRVKNINTTILLNKKGAIFSLEKENRIVLLCKLKKDIKNQQEILIEIKNLLDGINVDIELYKIYGIFDLKIVIKSSKDILKDINVIINSINNNLSDIQVELQNDL